MYARGSASLGCRQRDEFRDKAAQSGAGSGIACQVVWDGGGGDPDRE